MAEPPDPGLSWADKVLRLNTALAGSGLQYAFGGAIALNYHREPRSTLDIDINVFIEPARDDAVWRALRDAYGVEATEGSIAGLRRDGQTRTLWGSTFIDLFLSTTEFHASMAGRVERQPFGDAQIPVLSIEDLLLCKALFDRPKDWIDIEAVAATRGSELDAEYIRRWIGEFLGPEDPRVARLHSLL